MKFTFTALATLLSISAVLAVPTLVTKREVDLDVADGSATTIWTVKRGEVDMDAAAANGPDTFWAKRAESGDQSGEVDTDVPKKKLAKSEDNSNDIDLLGLFLE
ncbi:hypothetical protein BDP27DRAFT_1366299 [Rhodocollybia butyracea]|uniref:Uncharacterized protein n=1 Tax=Rhodocollybia butyracea TaxID=206335 RepID=A0A9P5PLT7_9AGAR|nr:hypothetical protein BDP27DRAFT_1366299 [Rhodocollybia butyracea]